MACAIEKSCGGCKYRSIREDEYRRQKVEKIKHLLGMLNEQPDVMNEPLFVPDECRRRATFAFEIKKKRLVFGFNKENSKEIVDMKNCPLLTKTINNFIPVLRHFLEEFCAENYTEKQGKKLVTKTIVSGDVFVCEADNGLDIVLECPTKLGLTHKMIISDFCLQNEKVIRVSHRFSISDEAETLIEKIKPFVKMGKYDVAIPAGTFLQPSKEGQEILSQLVLKEMQGIKGKIADLFCGVGTFSYVLADLPEVKIVASDSSKALLKGFKNSINYNQINNIELIEKNLFKYPPSESELKTYKAIVFDPPRAGAAALCQVLAEAEYKLEKIVAVSCNPATFVNDANKLISGGYHLQEITIVDQFTYSDHSELVACFTKEKM